MLMIRLQRIGKKKQPAYRVVVSEKSKDLAGPQVEILGNYNPVAKPKTIELKAERIKYWLSKGAQASATVHNLLVTGGVIHDKKVQAWKPTKKSQPKADQPLAGVPSKQAAAAKTAPAAAETPAVPAA